MSRRERSVPAVAALVTALSIALWFGAATAGWALPSRERIEQRVLRVALSGNPDTLDPQRTTGTLTFQVVRSVYDTLVEVDDRGQIVPALAVAWETSADGLTWSFTLRSLVFFHNAAPFTARDVQATFERMLDPEFGSVHQPEFAVIAAVEAPSDSTVVFRLHRRHAPFLASLASGWAAVLPHDLIAAGHDFNLRPVGTGPFTLETWLPDARIDMVKNPNYWQSGYPLADRLEFNVITEPAVQLQGLFSGALDIIDMVNPDDVELLELNPDTRIDNQRSSLVMVLTPNHARPPLDQLAVRQAISLAIDKQLVMDVAYGGGSVVNSFIDPSDQFFYNREYYPHDPIRARALVEQTGAGSQPITLVLPQNFEPHVKAGTIYQDMLSKVGFDVQIRLVDWSTWLSDVYRDANFQLTVIGHTGKHDPDGRLSGYGTERMYTRWINDRAVALIEQARQVSDVEQRRVLYDEVHDLMARELAHIYVGSPIRQVAMRTAVSGFRMDPKLDTYDFRRTTIRLPVVR